MAKTSKIDETVKISKDSNPNHKMIEESADQVNASKTKGFFSRKNIFFMILFFAISITLFALTIVFILNIDFDALWGAMSLGFGEKLGWLWFSLLIIYFVYSIFSVYAVIWPRLHKLGYKISQWEYWLFGLTISFFRATTPVLFSDPYFIFWLKTKGVPTSRATSILFSNTLMWQFVQFAVTFPSFVLVLINRDLVLADPEGISAFSFLCAGIVVDAFSIVFMIALNMSKSIHYALSRVFNGIKKKLHMKYHTKEEIAEKYKSRATIKQDFISYMKDWKTTLIILCFFVVNELILYFAVTWAMYFVKDIKIAGEPGVFVATFDFGWAFNSANVTFTANRLNFIAPNGEGSLQFFLSTFLTRLGKFEIIPSESLTPEQISDATKSVVNNSILIWRTFGAYLPAFFGLGGLIGLTSLQANRYKKNKKII